MRLFLPFLRTVSALRLCSCTFTLCVDDDGEFHNDFRNQDGTLQQALLDDASHSIYIDEESTIVGDGERARMQLAKHQKLLVCDNSIFLICCLNCFQSLSSCTIFNVSICFRRLKLSDVSRRDHYVSVPAARRELCTNARDAKLTGENVLRFSVCTTSFHGMTACVCDHNHNNHIFVLTITKLCIDTARFHGLTTCRRGKRVRTARTMCYCLRAR